MTPHPAAELGAAQRIGLGDRRSVATLSRWRLSQKVRKWPIPPVDGEGRLRAIDADFSKTFLFPPSFEDLLSPDHPARFIRELVDYFITTVKLSWKDESGDGRPPFAAALLMRVWLYGYMHNIRTVRKLEAACREHIGLLWLTGMNTPDHNTLWRFWRMNQKTIAQVFRESVRMAVEAGMVGFALHAVDGTKIQAKGSTRKAWSQKKLEKFLERVDQKIAALEAEIGGHEVSEDEGYRLKTELTERQALRSLIEEKLQTLASLHKTDMNPHEPEAGMVKTGSGTRLGYNGQMVADEKKGLIVVEDLLTEPFDQGALLPLLDLVEEQLGRTAEHTVADGGYNTEQTLVEAQERNRSITVAAGPADAESHPDEPYHLSRFTYDEQNDQFVCPRGERLGFDQVKTKEHDRKVRVYRCTVGATCPVAGQCTKAKNGRTVERSPNHEVVERHRQRRRSEAGRERLKRRSTLGERPFAVIKRLLGFVRFRAGGKANAAAEWTWICLTHNLKILMAQWQREVAA
ncbi:MAG TPA: IS1182 family transposase [Pyrinomonadaceae bacterium]